MALPWTTIQTLIRTKYLPVLENAWARKDYALLLKLRQGMKKFQEERFDVMLEYYNGSNGQHIGVDDSIDISSKEIVTKGTETAQMFIATLKITHKEYLSMNAPEAVENIVNVKMENVKMGFEEDLMKHTYTRSPSSTSQWNRIYDIVDNPTAALHGLTPSDFPDSDVWTPNSIDGSTYGADANEDALMDASASSYLPRLLRRGISQAARRGRRSDLVGFLPSGLWGTLLNILDDTKRGRIESKDIANLGFENVVIDGVPFVEDPWLAYYQTADTDGQALIMNMKKGIQMQANPGAMFTMGDFIEAQNTTYRVAKVTLYGNLACKARNANTLVKNLYCDRDYNGSPAA